MRNIPPGVRLVPENDLPLNRAAHEQLKRLGEKPDESTLAVLQLARWALIHRDEVNVAKKLRYTLGQYLDRLEAEPPAQVVAWLYPDGPPPGEELLEVLGDEAAAECLEIIRLRMAESGFLDHLGLGVRV